jgi:hypothetical protein
MVSRDKPAAAEYGARRAGLTGNRELQAPRESVAVLDSSLERVIILHQKNLNEGQPAFSEVRKLLM